MEKATQKTCFANCDLAHIVSTFLFHTFLLTLPKILAAFQLLIHNSMHAEVCNVNVNQCCQHI